MKLTDFDYALPEDLIAQKPVTPRDSCRLLVADRQSGKLDHLRFSRIGQVLPPGAVLVFNNSKVVPARLLGRKERSGGQVEIFVLGPSGKPDVFKVLMRPLKKIKDGDVVAFDGSPLKAVIIDREKRLVRFSGGDLSVQLEQIGHMPLPPYVKRRDVPQDREDYQTVYARYRGSVASPTAGLHFTRPLIKELKSRGHHFESVTLHISYATFKPVEAEDIRAHQMHTETYSVPAAAIERLKRAKKEGRKVFAVGTTCCRVLESAARTGRLKGKTDLFIYPGFRFQWVDGLITNFHQPRSTLLMLVYAFGGPALMKKAYTRAVRDRYRFFSYGDAMLIR